MQKVCYIRDRTDKTIVLNWTDMEEQDYEYSKVYAEIN